MSKNEMQAREQLVNELFRAGEWDGTVCRQIAGRLLHNQFLKFIKEEKAFDSSLPLSERIEAFRSKEHDALFGNGMAHRFGFDSNEGILAYDVTRLPDNLGSVARECYVRYLRSLGCRSMHADRNPSSDGLNHYNIYSQARTEVGKMASNFESAEGVGFDTPHGRFKTLEGYYHVLRVLDYFIAMGEGSKDVDPLMRDICILQDHIRAFPELDELYRLDGATSIRVGREVKRNIYGGSNYRPGAFSEHAERCFMIALVRKLHVLQYDGRCLGNVLAEIVQQGVPLDHYYVMNGRIMRPKFSEWLPNLITRIVEHIDPYSNTFDPEEVIKLLE
ncbi:hypothetical protein BIZ83_gp044 [Erwinia phage vB_EamM_ChrisDB]|uniref:hypothetical protein n=1 Tax=Erwinia phage vB_EamM_ChrisDB TaxID=1883371 RepID=UPI00081C3A9F|nr:hypothetical protein BIZ83_gp044 [Erwinia phage vB_EamM_ChrisDB]ANZ48809.1 hypothetical protein CHRISDB_247 [Erwinia phage vB_EamM_ChrisDB]